MRDNGSLPSYEQLFGALDFREGDDSRSVYSPAAYLADLLQLLEENFDAPSLMQRRPDLKEIPLDASHTYTEVPYLDIVNGVLEKVLENGEDTDSYSILSALRFPFVLPFSLGNERLKKYLHYAQVGPEQLYGAFSTQPDAATVARVYLGLSIADRDLITTTLTGTAGATALAECYHLTADESVAVLEDVDRFLRATGMTGLELQELLYQSLSTTALDPAGRPERTRASEFFIHQGGTCVTLEADEQKLIWGDGSAPVPFAWFELVNRFVRLARKVSLSFTDLDLVLRSCCASRLDLAALGTIAVVTRLCDVLQLPVDVVCSLLAPLDTLGIGDETAPQDLFDRTFNVPFADIEKAVIPGSAFRPAAYLSGVELLTSSGDLLAMRNRDYRSRVARALAISGPDLSYIVTRFREHYAGTTTAPSPFDRDTAGVEVLSLLHRVSRLATALGISVTDLFGVLDALDRDPSIRSYTTFPVLIDTAGPAAQTQDCYRILEAADVPASLWLVQTVAAVATWMQGCDFTSQELNQILSGDPGSDPVAAVCAAVGQQFTPVLLVPGMFTSSRFSARASRVVHDAVMACDGLVSGRDRRLLIFDRERASAAAYAALTQLATVTAADFAGLGLADRLVAKIFANLVFRGYANADGTLVEGALPVAADGFCLAGDFTAVHDELFALIAGLCPAEADDAEEPGTDPGAGPPAGPLADQADGPAPITQALDTASWDAPTLDVSAPDTPAPAADASAQDISALDVSAPDTPAPDAGSWDALTANPPAPATGPDAGSAVPQADGPAAGGTAAPQNGGPPAAVSFFPSDLEALTGLPADQRAELYDNLVFNGYLSPDGTVPAPEFFTDPDNASAFTVNADLFGVGPAVLARIRQCYARFDRTPLTLTTAVFAELELTDAQLADLLENLRFNGYLDRGHAYVDKGTLLGLPPGRLDLALEFYPYRRALLDAVQQQITDFRSSCATVQAEDFRDIAEAAVTARVVERLTGPYLGEDGRLAADAAAFFGDPGNAGSAFGLDQSFLPNEQATAFQQMAAITAEWQSYALDPKMLADLHFDADESAALIGMLSAAGDLNQYLTIPRKRIAWFLRAASALAFNLPGIEDYERDIFSALHAVAKELSAGMTELVAALAALAGQQQAALGAAVADAFGLDAGTALALCEAIAGGAAEAPDVLVAPALAAATPAEDRFRRACRRIAQFAQLAAKLGLSGEETSVVFRDQDLVGKFGEPLALPAGLDRFGTLLDSADGNIYLFHGGGYWVYAAATRTLTQEAPKPLHTLSDRLAGVSRIDAAFTDAAGTEWLIGRDAATGPARSQVFARAPGTHHWVRRDHAWGRVRNNITDPVTRPALGAARIDTAFRDRDGKTYLFSGDQYVRYSGADYSYVDEGYPRAIAASWEGQQGDGPPARLPAGFRAGLDASFQGLDDRTYLFAGDRYACVEDGAADKPIADRWGRVRNVFAGATGIDAACTLGTDLYLFRGDQVIRYADSIENDGVLRAGGVSAAHRVRLPQCARRVRAGPDGGPGGRRRGDPPVQGRQDRRAGAGRWGGAAGRRTLGHPPAGPGRRLGGRRVRRARREDLPVQRRHLPALLRVGLHPHRSRLSARRRRGLGRDAAGDRRVRPGRQDLPVRQRREAVHPDAGLPGRPGRRAGVAAAAPAVRRLRAARRRGRPHRRRTGPGVAPHHRDAAAHHGVAGGRPGRRARRPGRPRGVLPHRPQRPGQHREVLRLLLHPDLRPA